MRYFTCKNDGGFLNMQDNIDNIIPGRCIFIPPSEIYKLIESEISGHIFIINTMYQDSIITFNDVCVIKSKDKYLTYI